MSEVKNVERLEKMNRYNAPIEQQFLYLFVLFQGTEQICII